MAVFVKNAIDAPKVFPLPTVRALSASNSPSALSAQALRIMTKITLIGRPTSIAIITKPIILIIIIGCPTPTTV